MKTLTLLTLLALAVTFVSCGRDLTDRTEPVDDSANRLSEQNTCASAGGTCVGISPTSCASGAWGDPSGCGDGIGVGCCLPAAPIECTPISFWPGNPASMYCGGLGHQVDGSDCVFADGSRCEQWTFLRGECGQAHSFCTTHGGSIASETRDFGEWSGIVATCTLPSGKKCDETAFARTCGCE